jgi:hypothetical protein
MFISRTFHLKASKVHKYGKFLWYFVGYYVLYNYLHVLAFILHILVPFVSLTDEIKNYSFFSATAVR